MVGESLEQTADRVLMSLRDNLLPDRFFSDLGFNYYGPVDGHDLDELIPMIENLSTLEGPVLLHVLTEKGHGAEGAENDPYKFHSPPSAPKKKKSSAVGWSEAFADLLYEEASKNPKLMAITAAMVSGTKLEKFLADFPEQSIDTGIAEAHAVTMAGGMEYAGIKPVVLIYSTFLQRAYDSIMHDICLQEDSGVIFALDRAGLVGDDGPSHHGVFDVAYLRHLPNMNLLAPRDAQELGLMFKWALEQKKPVAFRYPRGNAPSFDFDEARPPIEAGVPEVMVRGKRVALLAYGAMVVEAIEAVDLLKSKGIDATLVNMRFAKPLNADAYAPILAEHDIIVTMEDHVLQGGVGSALMEMMNDAGLQSGRLIRVGISDEFVTWMSRDHQFKSQGMDAQSVADKVLEALAPTPVTV
jgi:1-deoxy-D-xylulose-5-phosphate synthase